jgi:hypothetical protein
MTVLLVAAFVGVEEVREDQNGIIRRSPWRVRSGKNTGCQMPDNFGDSDRRCSRGTYSYHVGEPARPVGNNAWAAARGKRGAAATCD